MNSFFKWAVRYCIGFGRHRPAQIRHAEDCTVGGCGTNGPDKLWQVQPDVDCSETL